MLIEAFEEILREVAQAVLWLGALVLGVGLGSSFAVLGLGTALRARVGRAHAEPPPATGLCPPAPALCPPAETTQP